MTKEEFLNLCPKAGWITIMEVLYKELKRGNAFPEITTVKDKFGGLRVYLEKDATSDKIQSCIFAQNMSHNTCEECGTTLNVTGNYIDGWLYTLCIDCYKRRIK